MPDLPYLDPSLSVAARTDDLLARLTVEEKAGQLSQYFYAAAELGDVDPDAIPEERRELARQPKQVEAALRAGRVGSLLFVQDPAEVNRLQSMAIEGSRHGIPLIFGFDVIHGFRTVFPVPIAQAASWCPDTVSAGQRVAAREARAVGLHWTFAPMVDIARDPRWGRIIEGSGEDPTLGAAISAAAVRGFQGELGEMGEESVLACPKHFAGYGAAVGGRDYEDSDISEVELWNIYLPPFRSAVDAGARTIMSAYMDLNGVPASGNRWLLTDVLRDAWSFDGYVVSDANAVRSLEAQHFARDLTDAAARALNAGLDLEMCWLDPAYAHLPEAVASGQVSEATLDAAVRRVIAAKFALGLFERPYVDEAATPGVLAASAHRETARVSAERSLVLLKNDGLLPLDASALGTVAVVGQLAASKRDTLGPWVFDHDTAETVTILDGLRTRLGDGVHVGFAPGAGITERIHTSMFDGRDPSIEYTGADHDDEAEIARAVTLAAASDVAVVVVGQRQNQIGEKASTATLDLPGRQAEQLERIVATGTPVVVVVMSGRPLDLRSADAHAPAILQAWYPGTRGGDAVAAALVGDVSPAGRLPFTWPQHVGQVPMFYNHYRSFQPEEADTRYWEEESSAPLYPFGHGLSYASFTYSHLSLDAESVAVGDTARVSVTVSNTSDRDADEVAQLYIHQRYGTSTRPIRELKGFQRVTIPAGESRRLTFDLGPDQLRYWSTIPRDWVQDATTIDVYVGGSSTAALQTVLEVTPR